MSDLWLLLAALAAIAGPLALAWWLLGRPEPRQPPPDPGARRGKMPPT